MERVILSLMVRHDAEEAVKTYVSLFFPVFGESRILKMTYYGGDELEALRAGNDGGYHARAGRECQDHPFPALRAGDPRSERRGIIREFHRELFPLRQLRYPGADRLVLDGALAGRN